ncbi:MAG TPA: 2OG-Fe(II) oxygenase [Acetobacteraceae bacterium]
MAILDLAAFRATPASSDPFPYVIVPNFVPPAQLDAVLADLPEMAKGGSFPIGSLRLGPTAQALLTELEGPAFRDAIGEKLGIDLEGAVSMTTLRGRSREKDGRIHCDSTAKRITVLLYLNREADSWSAHQGCLRLLRQGETLDDFVVEVPPVNGTLLVFPNSSTAWHGHKQFVGPRYVVQLNYMTGDAAARSELRRHRISAFLKRLTQAA